MSSERSHQLQPLDFHEDESYQRTQGIVDALAAENAALSAEASDLAIEVDATHLHVSILTADNGKLAAENAALRESRERLRAVAIDANVLRQNCGICHHCGFFRDPYFKSLESSVDLAIGHGDLAADWVPPGDGEGEGAEVKHNTCNYCGTWLRDSQTEDGYCDACDPYR